MKRMRWSGVILPFVLLWCGSAKATWEDHLASVHFNSAKPDFGFPPRRASAWTDEADIRPGAQGDGGGGGTDHWELSPERDAQRLINHRSLRAKAIAQVRTAIIAGNWRSSPAGNRCRGEALRRRWRAAR
ncbi:MAG: hypothetical protein QM758_04545 [Armatimonas sp.]